MGQDAPKGASKSDALSEVLSAEQVTRLEKHWITNAEEFLAAVATEEGNSGVQELLGVTEQELAASTRELAARLPANTVQRLRNSTPGGPLGAILPEKHDEGRNQE
ncbi:MAG: hypothetical protein ACOC8H_00685 [bacterium]